jgi:hypothetical protein
MIAETLLLLNNDPSKPLNEHFNDSLVDLKNWISNAIQYIEADNVLKVMSFGGSVTLNHSGTLKIKVGSALNSGLANSVQIYINDVLISTIGANDTEIINVSVGDVLRVALKANGMRPEYIHLCGFPILLDL